MKLSITSHAKRRLIERNVDVKEVREYIERYGYILGKDKDGCIRFKMREGKKMVTVVIKEVNTDEYILITVIKGKKQKIMI